MKQRKPQEEGLLRHYAALFLAISLDRSHDVTENGFAMRVR
jgi:hypothetical protein